MTGEPFLDPQNIRVRVRDVLLLAFLKKAVGPTTRLRQRLPSRRQDLSRSDTVDCHCHDSGRGSLNFFIPGGAKELKKYLRGCPECLGWTSRPSLTCRPG